MNAMTVHSRALAFHVTLTISLSEHEFASPSQPSFSNTLTHTYPTGIWRVLNITLWNSYSGAYKDPERRASILRSLLKSPASKKLQFLRKDCIIAQSYVKTAGNFSWEWGVRWCTDNDSHMQLKANGGRNGLYQISWTLETGVLFWNNRHIEQLVLITRITAINHSFHPLPINPLIPQIPYCPQVSPQLASPHSFKLLLCSKSSSLLTWVSKVGF